MTRDDSLTIVQMLVNSYPGSHWHEGSIDAYARAIEPLDAALATAAVARAVKELDYYPKVATLRELVRIERALADPEPPADRMASVPEFKRDIPHWVKRWVVARRHGDMRVLPEQKVGYDSLQRDDPSSRAYVWPDQTIMPADQWLEEADHVTDEQVFRTLQG